MKWALMIIFAIAVFYPPARAADDEEWKAKNPSDSKLASNYYKSYKKNRNLILEKILSGTAESAFNAPGIITDWYDSVRSGLGAVRDRLEPDVLEIAEMDCRRFLEIANRRKFQVSYISMEKTKIEKRWKLLYSVKIGDRDFVIPPPESCSVHINPTPSPDLPPMQFVPTKDLNEAMGAWQTFQRKIWIDHYYSNPEISNDKSDMEIEREEISALSSKGWVDKSNNLTERRTFTTPIFEDKGISFCYGIRQIARVKFILNGRENASYRSTCLLLINNMILQAVVDVAEDAASADEAWANALLSSWRDAILAANGE